MHLGLIFCLIFFYFFTQFEFSNELPRGVHQWAQADRYAISARFADNQPFTKPATYSIISDNGEVGVEYPLIPYVAAKIAIWVQAEDQLAFIYRFLTFSLLLIGLYLLVFEILKGRSFITQIASFVLLFSSPILLFYGYNFLPDAAALGLVLWAMSLIIKNTDANFTWIVFLLGIAALIKTSSAIYLIAFGGYNFIVNSSQFKSRRFIARNLSILLVLALISYYDYYYIIQRNKELWSTLFLSQGNPISSFSDLFAVLNGMWHWKLEYFNMVQWIVLIIALIAAFYYWLKEKKGHRLRVFFGLSLLGVLGILWLFGLQFINHDYYFLASFMPLNLAFSLVGIRYITSIYSTIVMTIALCVIAVASFSLGSNQHFDRMSETCTIGTTHMRSEFQWLKNLKPIVNDLIAAEEKVFVLYEMEPNLSLVYLDRLGIVFNHEEMGREESNFYYWLERRKPDFILCRTKHFSTFEEQHQEFLEKCSLVKANGDYKLFRINGY